MPGMRLTHSSAIPQSAALPGGARQRSQQAKSLLEWLAELCGCRPGPAKHVNYPVYLAVVAPCARPPENPLQAMGIAEAVGAIVGTLLLALATVFGYLFSVWKALKTKPVLALRGMDAPAQGAAPTPGVLGDRRTDR